MKPILIFAIAALALGACSPKPTGGADPNAQTAQGGQASNAGCTTTRDANNNVVTQCP
jgi:hypothetical protein